MMRHPQQGGAGASPYPQEFEKLSSAGPIDSSARFVQQQGPPPVRQRPCNRYAPRFAGGQGRHPSPDQMGGRDLLQRPPRLQSHVIADPMNQTRAAR